MKSLIVGNGSVGKALAEILGRSGHEHAFFQGRSADSAYVCQAQWADVIYVAIPSGKHHGRIACEYILRGLEQGKVVETAEKGSLAYHFDALQPHMHEFGHTATVGGASGMLSLFDPPGPGPIRSIFGIVNGTFNLLSCYCEEHTCDPRIALTEAARLQMTDAHSLSLMATVNAEMFDALMKTAIILCKSGLARVTADNFSFWLISEEEAERLLHPGKQTRFVVSIEKAGRWEMPSNGFGLYIPPWHVQGRFVENAGSMFRDRLPRGAMNRLVINTEFDGWCSKEGVGAGADATAKAMVNEAELLLARRARELAAA